MKAPTTSVQVVALRPDGSLERPDRVVTEEPLQVRLSLPGGPEVDVAVTLRTPGNDTELAVGLLVTEGIITSGADVAAVRVGTDAVTVALRGEPASPPAQRRFVASASCGTCGKASVDDLEVAGPPLGPGPVVPRSVLVDLPERLRGDQRLFDRTGGLHAAGRFTAAGEVRAVREDVGRHNAVDTVVGAAALAGELPLTDEVLVVSGRVSFEIVQKAAVAGLAVLAAVSAPSSLAVSAARRRGVTLVGFVRDGTANVYTHPERIDLGS